MTASATSFVNGKSNGTGMPQFVTSLQNQLQKTGDVQALAFFSNLKNSNSPFAASITSSLKNKYLESTSLAGFFSANQCTLSKSSKNINSFLAGNWSQGGVGAWLSLTTQDQNNPYTLYEKAQNQLASVVNAAQTEKTTQLNWGQGMLSWCGNVSSSSSGSTGGSVDPTSSTVDTQIDMTCSNNQQCPGVLVCISGKCIDDPLTTTSSTIDTQINNISTKNLDLSNVKNDINSAASAKSLSAGDPCTKKDGSPGQIKTPGSVISGALGKALGVEQDKLAQLGSAGTEINKLMSSVGDVLKSMSIMTSVVNGATGGLLGVTNTSATDRTSEFSQYDSSGFLGATATTSTKSTDSFAVSPSVMTSNIARYQAAWNTISTAANTASTTVASLLNTCASSASEAQTALDTEIAPVLKHAAQATVNISQANDLLQQIQIDLEDNSSGTAYTSDMVTLQTTPPTSADVSNAEQNAQITEFATTADPNSTNSLTVSGASILDQMILLTTNANALKASCGSGI